MTTDQSSGRLDVDAEHFVQLLEVRDAAKALLDLVTPMELGYFVDRGDSLALMTARLRLRAAITRSEG